MAFNNSITKVAKKGLVKVVESKVNGRVSVSEEKVIEKTLDGMGSVSVLNDEKLGENIVFSGVARIMAYYLDGGKNINAEELSLDFNEKVVVGDVESTAFISTIKSIKVVKESEKSLGVTVIVETKIYGVLTEEVNVLGGEEEGFFAENKNINIDKLTAYTNTGFTVSNTLDDIKNKDSVLGVSSHLMVNRVVAFDNYVTVDGSVIIDYLVRAEDQIKKLQKSIDFTEEVPVLNMTPNTKLDYMVYSKGVLLSDGQEEGASLILDINIGVAIWGFVEETVNIISDAFSEDKLVSLTYSNLTHYDVMETKPFSEKKSLVVSQENKRRIDDIIFVKDCFISKINEIKQSDGAVDINGEVKILVVYKNYDADETFSEMLVSNFDLSIQTETISDNDGVEVIVKPRVTNYKNKAGKELTVFLDFDGTISFSKENTEQYVLSMEIKEDLPKNRSSIVLYKPKNGESVFEIAKKLSVSPDVVLTQNPQLQDGEVSQIVVYRKLK